MKIALSQSHRANKQGSAHTRSHDWENMIVLSLANAHTIALKRTHSPLCRMVHSSDKFPTGSHLEKFGVHDNLLPPLQVKTSHRTHSSSYKPPYTGDQPLSHSHSTKDDLIQSPPCKTARIDDTLVKSQAEDGSACPMTLHSSHKISQNNDPSQSEAEAV